MATLGKLHEFKPKEEFANYLERVEIYFAANGTGIEGDKQVPVFPGSSVENGPGIMDKRYSIVYP